MLFFLGLDLNLTREFVAPLAKNVVGRCFTNRHGEKLHFWAIWVKVEQRKGAYPGHSGNFQFWQSHKLIQSGKWISAVGHLGYVGKNGALGE